MNLRFSSGVAVVAISVMACTDLLAQVPSPTPGLPSPIAPPSPSISATNTQRTTRRDGLKYLEEELTKSLQFLSGRGSLDGVLAPPPIQAPPPQGIIRPQRSRDNSDTDGLWSGLARPEENQKNTSDILTLPGKSRNDRKQAKTENLYEKLRRESSSSMSQNSRRTDPLSSRYSRSGLGDSNASEDEGLPGAVREKERALREKITGEKGADRIFNPGGGSGVFSEMFNPGEKDFSRDQLDSHREYLDRYRQMLAAPGPGLGTLPDALKGGTVQTPNQSPAIIGSDSLNSPFRRDSVAATPSGLSIALRPAALPNVNEQVLNRWNPLYEAPRFEPAKPSGPQSPPFLEVPRRKF